MREYRASESGAGLQAPNRAHNLRTWFEKTGIRVHDRTAGGSPELLRLSLARVGRGGDLVAVPPGTEVVAHENRVEVRRPGLVEWYVNSPTGLEQGFTLAERPPGEGALVLELAAEGARTSLRGDEIAFASGDRTLRYGELVVSDAGQRATAARFELASPDRLRIVVDDAGATYPLVIDPLLTETADTQLESNQASGLLGVSVASAGDVNGDGFADVIAGAWLYDNGQTDEGAAFVFLGSASGIADGTPATASAQLESDQGSALLGKSVASAGDVNGDGYADVIVSATGYDSGESNEGAAFVFLGSASGIVGSDPADAHAQLESNQASANFGVSVASAGDVNGDGYADVIVGSDFYDAGLSNEGAAFVFLGSTTGIADGNPGSVGVALLQSDQASAFFGYSVASAGDVNGDGHADVIVGARLYDEGLDGEGAAFVFLGSASGVANGNPATAAAQLESDQAGAEFGESVASAGDVNGDGFADVIVGADFYDSSQANEGAAFVFHGSATGIADGNPGNAAAQLESDQASAEFGQSVASAGDVNGDGYADVIVGARLYDDGQADEGAAFVFLGSASGIADANPATAAAQLESNQASADFGTSVAGAGDVNGDGFADVIAGAEDYDSAQSNEGAAFVFLGGAAGIADGNPASPDVSQLDSNQAFALNGSSVASAGDVNGDGYSDVIVGAPLADTPEPNAGGAGVGHGGPLGIGDRNVPTADALLLSHQDFSELGTSVASAGDVNGDGFGDVIVGAPFYDQGQTNEGVAFVFLGSPAGIADETLTGAAQLEANQASAQFGTSVASAGDVNGDGFGDVIVGAPLYESEGAQSDEGAAFVFHGTASGLADGSPPAAQLESDQASAQLGRSVAGAGDLNGDGFADVIVGAPEYDTGGAAFVFHGSASGLAGVDPATSAAQLDSDQASAQLGWSVAAAGDVNGDGFADVIAGAPAYDGNGAAFIHHGSTSGIAGGAPGVAAAQLVSDQAPADLGESVASAGDVNGDGFADVIVGAPRYDAGQEFEGAAFVFLGSASGVAGGDPSAAAAQLEADQAFANLGRSVASAGDTNGDGYADVIVGAEFYDRPSLDAVGAAFVFLGNSAGRPVLAHQQRGDGSGTPVQPWGLAHSTTGFTVELVASHPAGGGRVRGEIEACPPGVPFGHASCAGELSPSWVDVDGTTPEAVLAHTVSGLTDDTLYRWRARVLHAPSTGAVPTEPAHGPWRRLGAQAVEADIRLPEPGALLSLASGLALLAVLGVRRSIRSVSEPLR